MGLFSTKQTSKSTPIVPGYIESPMQDAFGRVQELGRQHPWEYVAPTQMSQAMADTRAQGLTTSPLYDEAASGIRGLIAGPGASAGSGQWGGIDKFMNPYQRQVVDEGLSQLNRQGDRQMQGVKLGYAGPNYGNNAAVAEALTAGEINANTGNWLANTLSGGFDRAASLADSQAGRDQQTNMLNAQLSSQERAQNLSALMSLGSLGGAQGAEERANIGTLLDTGGTIRGIDSDMRRAPLDLTREQAEIYSLLNPGDYIGQNVVGKNKGGIGNLLLANAAKGAAALAGGGG